jgi:hypothetical protein
MRRINELSSKSGPGRFPYRQNEYEREEKWQLSAERVPGALSTPAADPRPCMKAKITSGKAAPKNNWIWTGKLKQQHGSGVGSLVHAAESRQEQTLIHSALTKKIRTKKTSNGPSEADSPCGFQEQKNEVKKDMEIGAGQNGTQQPKTT